MNKFLQRRSQINTLDKGMLMRAYNILFTINLAYLSIIENTMSSLLSMALARLTQPYKNIGLNISLLWTE